MGGQVTITAKIPADLKKRLSKLEVNVSAFVRRSLEREVERLEKERLRGLLDEAGDILRRIPPEEIVQAVRAGRESR